MLTTGELERTICKIFEAQFPGYNLTEDVNFAEFDRKSRSGIYIYSKKGKYHYVLKMEGGEIYRQYSTENFDDILYDALDSGYIFRVSEKYAYKNRAKCMDARRIGFQKRYEIMLSFGKEMGCRMKEELEEVLRRAPYRDWVEDISVVPDYPNIQGKGEDEEWYSAFGMFRELEAEVECSGSLVKLYFVVKDEEISLTVDISFLLKKNVGEEVEGVFGDGEKTKPLYRGDILYVYMPDFQKYLDRVWKRHPEGLFFAEGEVRDSVFKNKE